jgi:hypothetical protein
VRPSSTVALAAAAAAVAVRLPGVYTQAFWEDEVASARILREPTFVGMLRHVARTESTPPLWYALGWALHRAGVPLVDVRLVAVFAGAALAAVTVDLASRFLSLPLAALAGALVALGSQFVAHGQELRAYELLALLAALFGRSLLSALERPARSREAALVLVVAAGGLTHYFFAFTVLAAGAWLALDRSLGAARLRALGAIAVGSLLPFAWAPVMLTQYHADRFWWIGPFRLRHVVAVPLRLFTVAYDGTQFGLALSAAAVVVVAAGAARLGRTSSQARLVGALALGPLVLVAGAWAAGARVFALRNLVEIGPFVAIAAAAALSALPRRAAFAAAAAATTALAASLAISDVPGIPPYDVMARALARDGWRTGDALVVYGDPLRYRAPLEWYLPQHPTLDLSRPLPVACGVVYVIRPRTYRVERLRLTKPLGPGATLLTVPRESPRCAAPVHDRRFAPLS